jgi:hypothetical protein
MPRCVGITVWGVRDPTPGARRIPLLFDGGGGKKAAPPCSTR